jgi:ABC-type amino acid transport system permease subunit
VAVVALGFLLAIFVAAGRLARSPFINKPVAAYIEFFRALQRWSAGLGLLLPPDRARPELGVASIILALTLNVAAFYAESIRAGIRRSRATRSADILRLSYVDKMRFVILPQHSGSSRSFSQSISLFKDTAPSRRWASPTSCTRRGWLRPRRTGR